MSVLHKGLLMALTCVFGAGLVTIANAGTSGAFMERVANGYQARGKFDAAAYAFQKAADAYRDEGNSAANARALRELAGAYEKEADSLTANNTRAPAARTAAPAPVKRQMVAAAGGGAGVIPSGHYGCDFGGGGSPGYVDIRGRTYRPPTLTASGDFRPYTMGAGNSITWTAGFGEFKVVSSKYMGADTNGRPWFSVTYSRTHGGGVDELDCLRE